MRDRLTKLLGETRIGENKNIPLSCILADASIEKIADHLIENGVIVPPMRLGQTCFEPCAYRNGVDECRVSSITQKADGSFKIRLTNLRGKWVFEITPDEIGKTVFLTREEAEKALAEREEKK
jgi:hypothetical protein